MCNASEGTMSGGGNKVVKGRMSSCIVSDVNPAQLEAMEKTLEREIKATEVSVMLIHSLFTGTNMYQHPFPGNTLDISLLVIVQEKGV